MYKKKGRLLRNNQVSPYLGWLVGLYAPFGSYLGRASKHPPSVQVGSSPFYIAPSAQAGSTYFLKTKDYAKDSYIEYINTNIDAITGSVLKDLTCSFESFF